MLRSIFTNRRTAVAACHASSKTFTAAEALLHWVTFFKDGKVITTAPTDRQVRNLVWREVREAVPGSRLEFAKPPGVQTLEISPQNYAFGMSTKSQKEELAVRFQGLHGGHVLIIIDEAPGVEADIWDAISGIRAGGVVHVLAIGNPTIPSGPFYDAFTTKRELWNCINFDAFDMPNMDGIGLDVGEPEKSVLGRPRDLMDLTEDELDDDKYPFLNGRRWVKEMLIEYGVDSPRWEARVRGQFPTQSEFSVFSLRWLEDAKLREMPDDSGQRWSAGIDVAGEGDDETVCYIVDGTRIVDFIATGKPDPRGAVVQFLNQHKRKIGRVAVDKIGLGYNFMLHIRDQGYTTIGINVGEGANDNEKFFNLKAELFWKARGIFELSKVANLTDERTISQLSGIRYSETPKGQTKIESKDDARKRGVKSPDRAESLILALIAARSGRMSLAGIGNGLRFDNPTANL